MASVVITGDTSGSITLAAPAVAGTNTLTLPANTGTVITTASSGQSIPRAALPAGAVLQVVNNTIQTVGNYFSTSSSSLVSTGVSVSITPSSSTNKVLLTVNATVDLGANNGGIQGTIYRGATNLGGSSTAIMATYYIGINSAGIANGTMSMSFLDSPSTTSSTTYTIYVASSGGAATVIFGTQGRNTISFTAQEIAA